MERKERGKEKEREMEMEGETEGTREEEAGGGRRTLLNNYSCRKIIYHPTHTSKR